MIHPAGGLRKVNRWRGGGGFRGWARGRREWKLWHEARGMGWNAGIGGGFYPGLLRAVRYANLDFCAVVCAER